MGRMFEATVVELGPVDEEITLNPTGFGEEDEAEYEWPVI